MTADIHVLVRCFAAVRECFGVDSLKVALPAGSDLARLVEVLGERQPRLRSLRFAFAVNAGYARPDRVLQDGDEVALIPPISGGAPGSEAFRLDLTEAPLDPRALELEVRTDRDGAVVTFAGTTRNHNDGEAVVQLAYEAYAEMAQKVVAQLFAEAAERFGITRARIAHRLGVVPVGETCVLVVVAAEHRGPAFDACRFLMDRVKHEAPIWKRETLVRGDDRWVGELPQPGGG